MSTQMYEMETQSAAAKTGELRYAVSELWDKVVLAKSLNKERLQKFEGPMKSRSVIVNKKELLSGGARTIHMVTRSKANGEGQTTGTMTGNEDDYYTNGFDVTVGPYKNAIAIKKTDLHETFLKWSTAVSEDMSEWVARTKDRLRFKAMTEDAVTIATAAGTPQPSIMYSNNKTAITELDSTCRFGTTQISLAKLQLQMQGAIPIATSMDGKNEIENYGMFISSIDAFWLGQDPVWRDSQKDILPGKNNPIFTGALGMWDGVWIWPIVSLAGQSQMGSPLRPQCQVYGAHDADATTIYVGGPATFASGATNKSNYTAYFPSSGYGRIKTSAGAYEFFSYTGKTSRSFTGVTRAVAFGDISAALSAPTTGVGRVLATGDVITLNNAMSIQIAVGCEAVATAWSEMPHKIDDLTDYKDKIGLGMKFSFGNVPVQDVDGAFPNFVLNYSCAYLPGRM